MPQTYADVSVDDLFDALVALGCPVAWLDDDGPPGDAAVPQMLGIITAAVERLIVARRDPDDDDFRRKWAAGYLMTAGAGKGPCGDRGAFDFITIRMRSTEDLFEGHRGGLMSRAVIEGLGGAVSAAAATCALMEAGGDNRDEALAAARANVVDGERRMRHARAYLEQALGQIDAGNWQPA